MKAVTLLLRLLFPAPTLNKTPGKREAGGVDGHIQGPTRIGAGSQYVWSDMKRFDSLSRLQDLKAVVIVALGIQV